MNVIGWILIAVSIALIVLVILQEGKNNRLSGAISGGNSDTFLGKSKTATKEKQKAKATVVVAVIFVVLVLVMHIMSVVENAGPTYQEPSDTSDVVDTVDTADGVDTTDAADTAEGEDTTADTEGDEH